ncbi:MAG: TGS domain-containing protein [Nanoarchaeota archaeon]|nr:TGS domain-containing protein [Nanoarchaeota archaeon]MCG2719524.1 TGS domain-containing protein [Nanoarchaeota archaeon]
MPINAGLDYQKAERKYHEARTFAEKMKALEEMLRTCPKHKGSESLQNEIKQKISKLKSLQEKQKSATGARYQVAVKKECAAQVVILGIPNSGKSVLLSKLTNAKPKIASYPFTTKTPEVGVMDYGGVQIQVVEIPAIIENFSGSDLGPTLLGIIRQADLIVIIANDDSELKLIRNELANGNVVTDRERPKIKIKKSGTGGIMFIGKIKGGEVKAKKILRGRGVHNAIVEFQKASTLAELEEAVTEGMAYVKSITISTKDKAEDIKELIWDNLDLIKVYTKQPGKKKDFPPIAMAKGSTLKDLAERVHKDFLKKFKFARVWGTSVKYPGAQSGLNLVLHNGDVVEFHAD